jgi:hypothetical protein
VSGLVAIRPESQITGEEPPAVFLDVEENSLPLAQHAEHRAIERARAKVDLGAVIITHDDPHSGSRVVDLDDPLHELDLLDLAGFDARSAYSDTPGIAAVPNADALDIGEPSAAGAFVGEADLFPKPRLLAADFTPVCHVGRPPEVIGEASRVG